LASPAKRPDVFADTNAEPALKRPTHALQVTKTTVNGNLFRRHVFSQKASCVIYPYPFDELRRRFVQASLEMAR